MKTEKEYSGWSVIKEDNLITISKKVTGSGVQQITTLGEGASLISFFASGRIKIVRIEVNFEEGVDTKAIEIDRVPLSTTSLKSILLSQNPTTKQSHILESNLDTADLFSIPFKLDFIITYTLNKNYEITITLMEGM